MKQNLSRREWLRRAVAASAVLPAAGANNRLNVGWIATGMRGPHVMNQMYLSRRTWLMLSLFATPIRAISKGKDIVQTEEQTTPKTTSTTAR